MDIGAKIKELRTKRNLTQEELAQKLGVTAQAVSRWECGISLPDITMIPLISKTFFVPTDVLFDCGIMLESCRDLDIDLDCSGEVLNQSQIDSILEGNDIVSDRMPKKVLIVDDSDFMRMMLKDILTKSGHTVLEADNGKLALKVLEKEKIDLCILDIMMPEMNGMETLKQILANIQDLPVIMLSALCTENVVREALRIGAKAFVAKPFQANSIIKRV